MNGFIVWCIIASAFTGLANCATVLIIYDELREIKREISRLKKKGGEG